MIENKQTPISTTTENGWRINGKFKTFDSMTAAQRMRVLKYLVKMEERYIDKSIYFNETRQALLNTIKTQDQKVMEVIPEHLK